MPPQTDTTPIALSPQTYERHAAAVDYVEQSIRNRDPLFGNGRFPGLMPGQWGLLASSGTISAGSGTTLGTGTVKICDREGNVLDDEDVDVVNAGAAITATGGGRIVRLGWTAGDWCVSCVGGES